MDYREDLMEIYKHPSYRGTIDPADVVQYGKNPMCGDELTFYVSIDGEGTITDLKYSGEGCAVSVIAAELLAEKLVGQPFASVEGWTKQQLLDMVGMNLTTSRVKCALLALETLQKGQKAYVAEKN